MKTSKDKKSVGSFLILLGLACLVYSGILYARSPRFLDPATRESVIQGLSLMPSLLGAAAILAGMATLLVSGHASRQGGYHGRR